MPIARQAFVSGAAAQLRPVVDGPPLPRADRDRAAPRRGVDGHHGVHRRQHRADLRATGAGIRAADLREIDLQAVFVPPMTGLATDEPLLSVAHDRATTRPLVDRGRCCATFSPRPAADQEAWEALQAADPQAVPVSAAASRRHRRVHIVAEYRDDRTGAAARHCERGQRIPTGVDAAGLSQHQSHRAVVLLDEPNAHLHMILQDAIYHELRSAAARHGSQLIVATHSEVVINSVEPRELVVTLSQPRLVADNDERSQPHFFVARAEQRRRYADSGRTRDSLRRGLHRHQHPA